MVDLELTESDFDLKCEQTSESESLYPINKG